MFTSVTYGSYRHQTAAMTSHFYSELLFYSNSSYFTLRLNIITNDLLSDILHGQRTMFNYESVTIGIEFGILNRIIFSRRSRMRIFIEVFLGIVYSKVMEQSFENKQ